jgi:hypothetical protein
MSPPLGEEVRYSISLIVCSCVKCVLFSQQDFINQQNAIQELNTEFNLEHGTDHLCNLVPKFHPELNPIEKCCSVIKAHVIAHCDDTIESLKETMRYALNENVLSIHFIRHFFRSMLAYYVAYDKGKDIIEADAWKGKHRLQRRHTASINERVAAGLIDKDLDELYRPHVHQQFSPTRTERSLSEFGTKQITKNH